MKRQHFHLSMPALMPARQLRAYVIDAVESWSGQFDPESHPLFGTLQNMVRVNAVRAPGAAPRKPRERKEADELTIAYLAMGACNAIEKAGGCLPDEVCNEYSGQLGFIQAVVSHALMLDEMADECADRLNGVFVYEVAEPFGERCAAAMISDEPFDERAVAAELLASITEPEQEGL